MTARTWKFVWLNVFLVKLPWICRIFIWDSVQTRQGKWSKISVTPMPVLLLRSGKCYHSMTTDKAIQEKWFPTSNSNSLWALLFLPYRDMYSPNLNGLFTSPHLYTLDTLLVLYKHQIYSHAHIHKVQCPALKECILYTALCICVYYCIMSLLCIDNTVCCLLYVPSVISSPQWKSFRMKMIKACVVTCIWAYNANSTNRPNIICSATVSNHNIAQQNKVKNLS